MNETIALQAAGVLGLGLVCQWIAWRSKLPAILFLLITGLLIGPASLNFFNPDEAFGNMLFPFVSLSIAIILFEGSLTLNFKQLSGLGSTVRNLVTIGAILTWLMITLVTHHLLALSWQISILFGAIVVVTGPTVIMPMLKSVRPNKKVAEVLRWEGIVIDPIGALLAVLVYEYFVSSQSGVAISHTLLIFFKSVIFGSFLGTAGAFILGTLIKRHWVPEFLQNFTALGLVLLVFSLSNVIEHESGLVAVTVMGIVLANMKDISMDGIYDFKEHLSVLLISCLFIILAARIDPQAVIDLGIPVVILLLTMQFIIRPLVILICTRGAQFSWQEKTMLSWIAPRGIVAAAVSSLFALRMEELGFENASVLVALTFAVILGTVLLQSATSGVLAKMLKVAEPSPSGILFVGANNTARVIATALQDHGYQVLMADTSWESIRQSRMSGLPTFYGNPLSEYADDQLNLIGIGHLIAATPQRDLNALASIRFRREFGEQNIYCLSTSTSNKQNQSEKHKVSKEQRAHYLHSEELSFSKFSSLLNQGGKVRSTTLSENYNFKELSKEKTLYPLFAIDRKRTLHIFSEDSVIAPRSGWTVISLNHQEVKREQEQKGKNKELEQSTHEETSKQDSNKDK